MLITGTARFIGFYLARLQLAEVFLVYGNDRITDYFDVNLKRRRHQMLLLNAGFVTVEGMLEDEAKLWAVAAKNSLVPLASIRAAWASRY